MEIKIPPNCCAAGAQPSLKIFTYKAWTRSGACLLLSLILLSACSSKKGKKAGEGLEESAAALSESDLNGSNSRFGNNTIPRAEGEGKYRDLTFMYDSRELSPESQQDVEANAQLMEQNPQGRFTIEGHCDERGTEEYNLSLGQARAKTVKDALAALGVSPSKLETISYGENLPLDPSSSEAAYARNRRVHIAVGGAGAGRSAVDSGEDARGKYDESAQDSGRY